MKGCAQWGSTAFRRLSAARMQFSECECLCRQECSAHIFARLTHGRTIHEIFLKQMKRAMDFHLFKKYFMVGLFMKYFLNR